MEPPILTIDVAGMDEDSITNGPGLRFVLFVQGCPHHCIGCHNPQTHRFHAGRLFTVEELFRQIRSNPLQTGVTFSGGEPFCQPEPLAELRISYLDYVDLNLEQRAAFLKSCADESQLCKLKTNYRMYKYSKWYKELQANNPDHLPVTTLLAQQVNGDK